ncbi:hypothetical protein BDF14DRAFT_1717995 [Spinellus fusiger]|nr:hypothetical protein BDF14DRAFT_1717995 [Spinellus fusiger]
MDQLEMIIFSGNTIGVEAGQALAASLSKRTTLKTAILSDIFTGRLLSEIPCVLKALCDALEHTQLTELDLSDNAFGPAGAEPLVNFIAQSPTLQTLRLNNNGLGIGGGTMIARALQASADKAREENRVSCLRTVICGRNRLEDGSSQALADAFAAHETLETVRMPQNGIRSDGVCTLMKGLKHCSKLRHLDLQDNTFTAKGSLALAQVLAEWPLLEILNVSDCLLSHKGGLALAGALQQGHNSKLTQLHLQYNEIQAGAVEGLAKAIESHLSQLVVIELNGNQFDAEDDVVEVLVEALKVWDHEDALDELDDMEEVDSEEEEEEDYQIIDKSEELEESTKTSNEKQVDQLAETLEKTHI